MKKLGKLGGFAPKYHLNYIAIVLAVVIYVVIRPMITGKAVGRTDFVMLEQIAIAMILATSLCMVVGFLGELSLGHAGFMCVGAFVGGYMARLLEPTMGKNSILMLLITVLVGGLAAAIFGIIIGLPALRLRGDYLAIVTLAFGEIVRNVIMNLPEKLFGGTLGLKSPSFEKKTLYIIAFVFVLITLAVIQNLLRSKHGRAITAVRDNEIAARAMGIDVTKYKLLVFTVSAFFAGIAGVLYSYTQSRVQTATFDYNYSIEILVIVVIGGLRSINGSIIAATLITYINNASWLKVLLEGEKAVLKDVFYALILIVVVIYTNAPALKSFRERYNIKALISKIRPKKSDAKEEV